jgi:RNA polymerase sigma-70 factor (ECF subfamily)
MSSSSTGSGAARASATSRSLLARVRAHDAAAWDRLVRLYAPFVLQVCRRGRLSREDVADVFQEVFQAAFARIESFEKARAGDTFRGWLRTITRHKVIDHLRREEREPRGEGGTEVQRRMSQVSAPEPLDPLETAAAGEANASASTTTPGPDTPGPDDDEMRLFRRALDRVRAHFHERTWRAFHGTVVDGRSPADVGEELGMSAGAVRVAKSRVLQRLRSELGDLG